MATTEAISALPHEHIVLEYISWETYQRLLEDLDQRPIRLTFDNGRLEIMPPLAIHEIWKKHLAQMVETMARKRRIRMKALGSTTFGREDLEKGLEPDECYYVAHLPAIQGKKRIDLSTDPPPDLAIEVDITRRSIPREPLYASLGVSELWRFDGTKLQVLKLDLDKSYNQVSRSDVFPFLPIEQFASFLLRMEGDDEFETMEQFEIWVKSL